MPATHRLQGKLHKLQEGLGYRLLSEYSRQVYAIWTVAGGFEGKIEDIAWVVRKDSKPQPDPRMQRRQTQGCGEIYKQQCVHSYYVTRH